MIYLFCILTLLISCHEQTTSEVTQGSFNNQPATPIIPGVDESVLGDIVQQISDSIWVIFQDKDDHFWFGSNGHGVFHYDPSTTLRASGKSFIRFSTKNGLSNDSIREIQQDKAGNMYFSTMNGICKFDGKTIGVLPDILSTEWKSAPDDLWFKGNSIVNGVYRWDGQTLYHLKLPKSKLEDELILSAGHHSWSSYGVYTIYKDSKENVWMGTNTFGACRYDPSAEAKASGKSFTWISEKEITFQHDAFGVRGIIEDQDGWMWLTNTLFRYKIIDGGPNRKEDAGNIFKKEKGIGNGDCDYFQYIVKDEKSRFWISTYTGGVWQYDPSGKKMSYYPVMKGNAQLPIVSLYQDKQGGLWLGMEKDGVYRFNGDKFEKFKF